MKITSAHEFRDKATGLLQSLPIKLKREMFSVLSNQVRQQVQKQNLSEGEIVEDFESWRKSRRQTRRRR